MFPRYEYRNSSVSVNLNQKSSEYPARFHKHLEIAFVEEGVLTIAIDNKTFDLQKGDLYIVFPNLLHAGRQTEGTRISIVIVDSELCHAFADTLMHYKPEVPVLRKGAFNEIVYAVFRRMYEINNSDLPHKQNALSGYLNALLGEVIVPLNLIRRDSDNDLIQQLILFFLENYTKEITLEDVARKLNYSKYYISHVISETFGCNFRPLINSYRVSMAQNLLLTTGKTIGEISYECGFKNQSSFNRIFLKHTGATPSAFRQQQETPPDKPMLYKR